MKRMLWSLLLAFGVVTASQAQVANGVITSYVDLYAGPDVGYPTIAQLPAGTSVAIQGCLEGWTWCDVITLGMRGWVAGTYVQYTYQNQPVIVADYGPRIGIPIVTFSIGAYWGAYYSNRPFYRNRNYWYSRPYTPRPPPRPPGYRPGYRPPAPGHRPPSGPAHRPPPNQGHRPPPNQGHRPPQGARPPQGGHPPQGARPPQGNHPPQGARPPQGNRPPQGGHPPGHQGGQRPSHPPSHGDNGH